MAGINLKPEIKSLLLKDILPDEKHARNITDEALDGLRKSLETFGYVDLIIINKRNMRIVAGHQRFKVLTENNVKRVPCVIVDVDDMMQQAMSVSLNNQQIAGYFTAALIPVLEQLRQSMPDEYIDLRLQELREELNALEAESLGAGKTLPDDIPPVPKKAVTKKGDLWVLRKHRLLCGNSRDEQDVARLMDGEKARLLATDPPYMVDYTGLNRPNEGKDWTGIYHEIEIKDADAFMRDFLSLGLKYSHKSVPIYIWHADRRVQMIEEIIKELDILWHQTIVWVKPAIVMTFAVYPWRHEPCLFGWRKGSKPFFRVSQKKIGSVWVVGLMRSGDPESPEYYSDIWELDWQGKQRPPDIGHPTVKPTEIFAIPMRVHTRPGDICYEPFSGSGSQIIAAERLNRRCFAMELEPVFVDVAVRRWEEFTGNKAELCQKKL